MQDMLHPSYHANLQLSKPCRSRFFESYYYASADFHERKAGIPALSFFDGFIISAEHKLLKPEKEIYEALYEKFSLKPEECFFIDDVQKNIDGARATGMDGHCYYHGDLEILKKDLISKGVKI